MRPLIPLNTWQKINIFGPNIALIFKWKLTRFGSGDRFCMSWTLALQISDPTDPAWMHALPAMRQDFFGARLGLSYYFCFLAFCLREFLLDEIKRTGQLVFVCCDCGLVFDLDGMWLTQLNSNIFIFFSIGLIFWVNAVEDSACTIHSTRIHSPFCYTQYYYFGRHISSKFFFFNFVCLKFGNLPIFNKRVE